MNDRSRDLTRGSIPGHVARMAIPMAIGLTAHLLLNLADGMYVSNLGTDAALAVLNYGFPLFYVPFSIFNGLNAGAAAALARFIGENKVDRANNTLSQLLWTGAAGFLVLWFFFPFVTDAYLHWLKVPESVENLTKSYLQIVIGGMFFTSLSLVLAGALRAEGNTRTLMNAMMLGTVVNLGLDPFLIFDSFHFVGIPFPGAGWGVRGAAVATLAANVLTFAVIAGYYLLGKGQLRPSVWPQWSDRLGVRRTLVVGAPAMLSQSMLGFMLTAITFLATPFGAHAVAAIGIGARLDIIAVFPSLAVMTAVVSLVGQNLGAQQSQRIRESVRIGLFSAFITLFVIGILVWIGRDFLVGLFGPEAEIARSAGHYLACTSLGYAFLGVAMVSGGVFQGLGLGWPHLTITTIRLFILPFTIGWILSRNAFGEYGIHYGTLISNVAVGIIATVWAWNSAGKNSGA